MLRSHSFGVIPRQKLFDLALFVAIDDSSENSCEIGMWLDIVEFAGLDESGDNCPVISACIMAGKECIFSVESQFLFILPMSQQKPHCIIDGIHISARRCDVITAYTGLMVILSMLKRIQVSSFCYRRGCLTLSYVQQWSLELPVSRLMRFAIFMRL